MLHPILRAAILSGFAFLIVHLARTDQLGLYIAPRMELYVKLSALGLYAASIYQVYAALRALGGKEEHAHDCGCEHPPSPSLLKNIAIYTLFILPLALGFLLPNTPLESTLAAKKGMSLNAAATLSSPVGTDEDVLFPHDTFTESYAALAKDLHAVHGAIVISEAQYIETLTALDLYREPFLGREVQISGFVYRDASMTSTQFAIGRFAMNCCSADALPYGLLVEAADGAKYDTDTWLEATGALQLTVYNGKPTLQLSSPRLTQIERGDTPYVYPDYTF
ncbi:TIGR03943 family putative permease subunit [Paenibacillus sp. SYP-B4298]|uniref:TIGR03943 family putative permease subunit n=1 Tax=Paenibacillus sp. SYP-B4298 TaxID=2996034 RepID=UPI0022DD9B00|nr:TIGR03943 family protein [Paenibacillus sp. SYP-B4298]